MIPYENIDQYDKHIGWVHHLVRSNVSCFRVKTLMNGEM